MVENIFTTSLLINSAIKELPAEVIPESVNELLNENPDLNESYLCKVDSDDQLMNDFKIMTATDLHITDINYNLQIQVLSNLIDLEKPDLVILNGDSLSHSHYTNDITPQQSLVKMFEGKQQY